MDLLLGLLELRRDEGESQKERETQSITLSGGDVLRSSGCIEDIYKLLAEKDMLRQMMLEISKEAAKEQSYVSFKKKRDKQMKRVIVQPKPKSRNLMEENLS